MFCSGPLRRALRGYHERPRNKGCGAAQEIETRYCHPSCLTVVLPYDRVRGRVMTIPRLFFVTSLQIWALSELCPSM